MQNRLICSALDGAGDLMLIKRRQIDAFEAFLIKCLNSNFQFMTSIIRCTLQELNLRPYECESYALTN
jgi:hypothetical protein